MIEMLRYAIMRQCVRLTLPISIVVMLAGGGVSGQEPKPSNQTIETCGWTSWAMIAAIKDKQLGVPLNEAERKYQRIGRWVYEGIDKEGLFRSYIAAHVVYSKCIKQATTKKYIKSVPRKNALWGYAECALRHDDDFSVLNGLVGHASRKDLKRKYSQSKNILELIDTIYDFADKEGTLAALSASADRLKECLILAMVYKKAR